MWSFYRHVRRAGSNKQAGFWKVQEGKRNGSQFWGTMRLWEAEVQRAKEELCPDESPGWCEPILDSVNPLCTQIPILFSCASPRRLPGSETGGGQSYCRDFEGDHNTLVILQHCLREPLKYLDNCWLSVPKFLQSHIPHLGSTPGHGSVGQS